MVNFLIGVMVTVIAGGGLYAILQLIERRGLKTSLGMVLLLVSVPKEEKKEGADYKTEINRFEQLLSNIASEKAPAVFEIAVPHIGEEIHFYLALPRDLVEMARKQVQGIWNGARVDIASEDYNIFNSQGAAAAAYVSLKGNFALPIRTYMDIGADTFSSIAGGFTRVNEVGEGASLQLILTPAFSEVKQNVRAHLELVKKGTNFQDASKQLSASLDILNALNPKTEKELQKETPARDESLVKALEGKLAKPLFNVNIRIVASASSVAQAEGILDGIAAGFQQFESPERNTFKIIKAKNPKNLIYQYIFRRFDPRTAMILSSEEIASIYHFPTPFTETPHVKWLKAKEAPPPSDLPKEGTRLGESQFRDQNKAVYITDEDRRRHMYLIGQTGTGKSTLMKNMVIEDIARGKGVALIDPHGDLAESILGYVPNDRIDDVIYFDPGDLAHPLGLNMLDYNISRPEEKTFIVNEMQSIFNKLFPPETMGPMFEQYMRNALLLLMEDMSNEPATLIEVPRIFTDPEFRKRKLARIHNPVVIDFWEKEAAKAGGDASLANMTPYITSKFNNFIANDYMRVIIGQKHSAFNFREVMDHGKILLINLSKGRIGDINANLLGMIITGKLLMAALSRGDSPEDERRDFNLYIDEFQNFTTDSIGTILSEARKYRLNLTMAHQFIAQLEEKIRDSVFGNVGSQIIFRVGATDAEFLEKQFTPTFNKGDLVNIDNLYAYVKLLINGTTTKPFNIRINTTTFGRMPNPEKKEKFKEYCRAKYGAVREDIEADIYGRLRK
ncbi:MAG: type IV secretion system DNA-binding domain-containing protein [bacterium]|nr:type IV secretion system DNA-binding domain-containing protein [bacterium]